MIEQQEFFKMVLHEFNSVKKSINSVSTDVAILQKQVNDHLENIDKEHNKSLKIKLAFFAGATAAGTTLLNLFVI